ncbi:MAG TPA: hypothetical protein VGG45_17800 [Terracidiphilus sp.]|jgi:hypothetical protein
MADAAEYAESHLATYADYSAKERILTEPFGASAAEEITPQQFD